jgi:hypothetical protein
MCASHLSGTSSPLFLSVPQGKRHVVVTWSLAVCTRAVRCITLPLVDFVLSVFIGRSISYFV